MDRAHAPDRPPPLTARAFSDSPDVAPCSPKRLRLGHSAGSIRSPAKAESAQPQLTVSPRGVLVSWVERSGGDATLKFSERTPTGWTAVKAVASGKDWFVNWADVPSVVRLNDGTLVGHCVANPCSVFVP